MRYYTTGNLEKLWTHIDNALSEINLANEFLMEMKHEGTNQVAALLEQFDESELVYVKSKIEMLIEGRNEAK